MVDLQNSPRQPLETSLTVWMVSNKTSLTLFATEEQAQQFVSSFAASVGGGLHISSVPVFGYATPAPSDNELIDAAQEQAANYDDDDRQDIKTDVMNAFYAGVAFVKGKRKKPVPTAPSETIAAAPAAAPDGVKEAWKKVREEVGTEGWTTADAVNYCGFFSHGWHAALAAATPAPSDAQDAARYRWMRQHACKEGDDGLSEPFITPEKFDEKVDAAMKPS